MIRVIGFKFVTLHTDCSLFNNSSYEKDYTRYPCHFLGNSRLCPKCVYSKKYSAASMLKLQGCVDTYTGKNYLQFILTDLDDPKWDENITVKVYDKIGQAMSSSDVRFMGTETAPTATNETCYVSTIMIDQEDPLMGFLENAVTKIEVFKGDAHPRAYTVKSEKFANAMSSTISATQGLRYNKVNTAVLAVKPQGEMSQSETLTFSKMDIMQMQMQDAGKYLRRSGNCRWGSVGAAAFSGIMFGIGANCESDGAAAGCFVVGSLSALTACVCELVSIHYTCKAGKSLSVSPTSLRFNF